MTKTHFLASGQRRRKRQKLDAPISLSLSLSLPHSQFEIFCCRFWEQRASSSSPEACGTYRTDHRLAMAEILGAATSATKFFLEVNQISIDNWTFKLYYKATTTILLASSVVASSKQFFGDPINCEVVRSKSSHLICPEDCMNFFPPKTFRQEGESTMLCCPPTAGCTPPSTSPSTSGASAPSGSTTGRRCTTRTTR